MSDAAVDKVYSETHFKTFLVKRHDILASCEHPSLWRLYTMHLLFEDCKHA